MKISELQTGDILLSQGHGFVSSAIKKVTDSKYSHVAIAIKLAYRGESCLKVFEAIGAGVSSRPFDRYLSDRHHEVSVYRLKDQTLLDKPQMAFDAFCMDGHDYNTSGIVKFFVDRAKQVKEADGLHARFCSELVSWLYRNQKAHGHPLEKVYHSMGLDLVPDHADHATSPGDIANSKLLECIGTIPVPERPEERGDWEAESNENTDDV